MRSRAVLYEQLSSQSTTLLCAEGPTTPLQIGGLCLFGSHPAPWMAARMAFPSRRRGTGLARFAARDPAPRSFLAVSRSEVGYGIP
jgi:hypothetical protein